MVYEEDTKPRFCSTSKTNDNHLLCNLSYSLHCVEDIEATTNCIYKTGNFWAFVLLMSIGTIGFNVVNSISDAICFDVIGKKNVFITKCFLLKKNY